MPLNRERPIRIAGMLATCSLHSLYLRQRQSYEHSANKHPGASGSASDRRHAFAKFAANHPTDPVDLIMGDWMSEANMTSLAARKTEPSSADAAFEPTFLEALAPALKDIAKYGIKVAVNAGGSDTEKLYKAVVELVRKAGLNLKVAWIEGDDVTEAVKARVEKGDDEFVNICTKGKLQDWPFKPIAAQAYLGGLGIAAALEDHDIVVCGRVSDASPVIGAAAWWHKWKRDQLDELANTFVAGHLIECSNYVCGGNFTGFRALEGQNWVDIGYPIAEIAKDGSVIITKQKGTGGFVTVDTCKAQLLYEIQGPWYFNSDVTAILDEIEFVQLSTDRVALKGVKSAPPPPTTKIGLTALGGFQAEVHYFLVGLDIEAKARMLEAQIRHTLGDTSRFHVLEFTLNGSSPENPTDQNSATVDFRVFAQARKVEDIMPNNFLRPIIDLIMCAYPGATFHLDFRQGIPKPFFEYYVTLLPQSDVKHVAHLADGSTINIPSPPATKVYPAQQPTQPSSTNAGPRAFGETVRGPLGWLVHARSGDKGSNANAGFWVRHPDEYEWLRSVLTVDNMKSLLAKEYNGKEIVSVPYST